MARSRRPIELRTDIKLRMAGLKRGTAGVDGVVSAAGGGGAAGALVWAWVEFGTDRMAVAQAAATASR